MHGSQVRSARDHRPGRDWGQRGLTRIEVAVIIGVLGMVAVILYSAPRFLSSRAERIACRILLHDFGYICREFATNNGGLFPTMVSTNEGGSLEYGAVAYRHWAARKDMIGTPKLLACPRDTRICSSNWAGVKNTNLSYFVSLDATPSRPDMILSGDRNLVLDGAEATPGLVTLSTGQTLSWNRDLHGGRGNLLFADGHVAWFSRLRLTSNHLSTNLVNRLAVP